MTIDERLDELGYEMRTIDGIPTIFHITKEKEAAHMMIHISKNGTSIINPSSTYRIDLSVELLDVIADLINIKRNTKVWAEEYAEKTTMRKIPDLTGVFEVVEINDRD